MIQFDYNQPLFWLIALPLLASPVVYILGRVGRLRKNRLLVTVPRWASLVFLILDLGFFAWMVYLVERVGPFNSWVEDIPLQVDGLGIVLTALALGLGMMVTLFSVPYMRGEAGEEKYYAMLLAMIGVMLGLGYAGDLFNLWLWFEAMAVSSYLLVVFYCDQPASLEAGVKYVIQSASGSVLVLLGIALVLAQTGTLDMADLHHQIGNGTSMLAAGALFVVGFGVKAALAPLHTWLPDAHTQAPSGISAMLSGIVIEAGLIAMLRTVSALSATPNAPAETWGGLLLFFGALNMLVGNLMALRQRQVKRLLAYSSLSHMGYIVLGIGIAAYSKEMAGAQGGIFHIITHGIMKGLAFLAAGALLYAISRPNRSSKSAGAGQNNPNHGPLTIADLDGAAQRYPLPALAFSLAVLGLGGLPPLAGFMSKWQIFVSGFNAQNFWIGLLIVFAALNSVLSLAYYAPLVNAIYRKKVSPALTQGSKIPWQMNLPLLLLALAVITLGVWPSLIEWLTIPAAQTLLSAFGG